MPPINQDFQLSIAAILATVRESLVPTVMQPLYDAALPVMQAWGKTQLQAWVDQLKAAPDAAEIVLRDSLSDAVLLAQAQANLAAQGSATADNADSIKNQWTGFTRVMGLAAALLLPAL